MPSSFLVRSDDAQQKLLPQPKLQNTSQKIQQQQKIFPLNNNLQHTEQLLLQNIHHKHQLYKPDLFPSNMVDSQKLNHKFEDEDKLSKANGSTYEIAV